jgi:virulence-associated protein VapD
MPNIWAIAYDLDVRGMKDAGYTKGNVTTFYISVRQCLMCNRFEKMQ